MKNITISLLFFGLFSFFGSAREPFFLMNYTNKLSYNVKQSRNAVAIYYPFAMINLLCGSGKVPSTELVKNSITEALNQAGVPSTLVFIAAGPPTGEDRVELSKLFLENNIKNVIQLAFTPMPDVDFLVKPFHVAAQGTIPADHPLCNPLKQIGLISSITIAPFSGDDLLFRPMGDAYQIRAAGINGLIEAVAPVFNDLQNGIVPLDTEYEFNVITEGKVIPKLPADISSAPIYVFEREEYELMGKPKGLVNKMSYSAVKSSNKTVATECAEMRAFYSGYDLDIRYYTYSNPIPENAGGYLLGFIDCHYDMDVVLKDAARLEAGQDVGVKYLAEFERVRGGSGEACDWMDPPVYRYYYLADVVSGDIYLVDYEVEKVSFDLSRDASDLQFRKSLESYLGLLSSH